MSNAGSRPKQSLGFLTVVRHEQFGLFGGYLILNTAGRPLEFHCTAPVKPNRAQEILYGPTLQAFLYGEQIGQTLIAQAGHAPLVVCTDQEPALAAREFIAMPLALVLPSDETSLDGLLGAATGEPSDGAGPQRMLRLDAPHRDGPRLATFQHGRNRLAVRQGDDEDRRLIAERLAAITDSFDLAEPFDRIRAAIEEAQQAVR